MGGEETRYIVRGSEKQQKRQKIQARQWRWRQRVIRNWNRPKGFAEGERESKEKKERERAEREGKETKLTQRQNQMKVLKQQK